jgi:hypothetical protein
VAFLLQSIVHWMYNRKQYGFGIEIIMETNEDYGGMGYFSNAVCIECRIQTNKDDNGIWASASKAVCIEFPIESNRDVVLKCEWKLLRILVEWGTPPRHAVWNFRTTKDYNGIRSSSSKSLCNASMIQIN